MGYHKWERIYLYRCDVVLAPDRYDHYVTATLDIDEVDIGPPSGFLEAERVMLSHAADYVTNGATGLYYAG